MTRHLNFLDDALDGYFFTNERNEVLFINRVLLQQLGYTDSERSLLMGVPLSDNHWDDPLEWELFNYDLSHEGSVQDRKVEMKALDGTPRLFKVSAVQTRDSAGRIIGAQHTLRLQPYTIRQSTAELRAENRELSALTAIGRNVLSTMDVDVVVQHLMHTVRALFDIRSPGSI
jgi:PAS domain-containing protein